MNLCRVLYWLFISVFSLEINLTKRGFGLTPSHVCACTKTEPGFLTSLFVIFLYSMI